MSKNEFPTELDCFKCYDKTRQLKSGETNDIAKRCHESGHECKAKSSFIMEAKMEYKLSSFFEDKTSEEQRLEIADEIDKCNGLLSVNSISISSHKGVIGAEALDSITSKTEIFPEMSNRLHQELLEVITKYRDELKKAKVQLEEKQLAKK